MGTNQYNRFTPSGLYQKIALPHTEVKLPWTDVVTHGRVDATKIAENNEYLQAIMLENHRYLDRVDWGSFPAGGRWRTIVIASADSTDLSRLSADFVCPSTGAEVVINRVIAAMEARSSSANLGRLVLLEGSYNLTGSITINALTSRVLAIEGMAGQTQSELGIAGTQINMPASSSVPVIDCAGVGGDPSGVTILENLAITGTTSTSVIKSRDMTLHVRQCRIINNGSGGAIGQSNSTGGSSNTIIDGNYCVGGSAADIVVVSSGPTRGTVSYVRNNTVINGSGIGIATGNEISSTPGYHVSDNHVYGNALGVGIQIGGTSTQDNVVADNMVKSQAVGIRVAGYRNVVSTNLIDTCASGILDGAFQLDASFIVGNNVIDSSTVGIRVGNTSTTKVGILGNKVVGYSITVPIAIQVGASGTGVHVYYNDIDSGVTTGISDSGTGTIITSGVPSGGLTNYVLKKLSNATGDYAWALDPAIDLAAAKGDLLVATAADVLTNLTIDRDGQILMGDSTQAVGIRWGPKVTISESAPSSPRAGDIWIDPS